MVRVAGCCDVGGRWRCGQRRNDHNGSLRAISGDTSLHALHCVDGTGAIARMGLAECQLGQMSTWRNYSACQSATQHPPLSKKSSHTLPLHHTRAM